MRLDPNETLQLSNFGTDQSGQITAELSLKPGLRDSVSIPSGFELTFANGNNDDEIVLRPTTRLTVSQEATRIPLLNTTINSGTFTADYSVPNTLNPIVAEIDVNDTVSNNGNTFTLIGNDFNINTLDKQIPINQSISYAIEYSDGNPDNATAFYFDNIQLDLGTFIDNLIGPVVVEMDKLLEPIYPIVEAMYADTHIFESVGLVPLFDLDGDGIVSPIDIAYWAANVVSIRDQQQGQRLINGLDNTVEFLGQVSSVLSLVSTLRQMSDSDDGFVIDFGSNELGGFNATNKDSTTADLTDEEVASADATENLAGEQALAADLANGGSGEKKSSSLGQLMEKLNHRI